MDTVILPSVEILGTGSYLPERVVTNDEVAPAMGSSDEWIYTHTGIRSRHFAADDESASVLGAKAAERALAAAGVAPEEIGLIVCATSSPDYGTYPATGCLVQNLLGCVNAGACDVSAACSGFIYALEQASCWVACHPGRKAIVLGTEVLSRSVDWTERTVSILFGDGAGAVVLGAAAEPHPRATTWLGADGSGHRFIFREGGQRTWLPKEGTMPVPYMQMQGRAVFNFAVKKLDEIARRLCADAAIGISAVDRVFAHQANARIIEAVARRMELPLEKFFMNLETIGNTSTASIPLCLDQAVRAGTLKRGERVILAGFGSGLTWGGVLMQWPYL
ncbi:MAG: beta-ketoacyl-ACP synthase III [Kiritimatiellia bacterium]